MPTKLLALSVYIGSIACANWLTAHFGLVPVGFGLLVTAGTFMAGLALLLRDWLQEVSSRTWVGVGIAAGCVVSIVTSTPGIAVASGLAFAASELVDWGVFSRVRKVSIGLAVLVSSIVSAPVDTVLFLWIAGFPVTWQAVAGQFLVKTAMALAVALVLIVGEFHPVPKRVQV